MSNCRQMNITRTYWWWVKVCLGNGLIPQGNKTLPEPMLTSIFLSPYVSQGHNELTHWGRVTHICVGKLTTTGSDNGLSPGRRQAIIWTNAGILLIRPLGTNFSEILIGVQTFSFKKMEFKMLSAKWQPFCLGHNEFIPPQLSDPVTVLVRICMNFCHDNALLYAIVTSALPARCKKMILCRSVNRQQCVAHGINS